MYYEINVAKMTEDLSGAHYRHFFATAPRSCSTEQDLKNVLTVFFKAFPEPQYNITATRWEELGTGVDVKVTLGITKPMTEDEEIEVIAKRFNLTKKNAKSIVGRKKTSYR